MTMTAAAPAGWYPDPDGQLRFWDGAQWTAQTAAPPSPAEPSPVQVQAPHQRRSIGRQVRRGLVAGGVLLVALVGVSWVANSIDDNNKEQQVQESYCQAFGANDPDC